MKKPQCGGCMGAPMRALSRACDSACDLYVRGMSGCARHVPSGAAGAVGRGGYGRSASSMLLPRTSSDRVEDLVRAASSTARQGRRVAAARDVRDATAETKSAAPCSNKIVVPERKMIAAAAAMPMGTIAEDAPCEFGLHGTCALPPPTRRRGVAPSSLATRTCGFGAVKARGARSSRANKP